MQVIPVLDILNGVVVHGIAGERDRYQPVRSVLTPSQDPSVILRCIHDTFGLDTFYIADLDAIEGRSPNRCTLAELAQLPVKLIVDAGVNGPEKAEELLETGIDDIVVALETLPDPEAASSIATSLPVDKLWFSLDLKNGQPVTENQAWQSLKPFELAKTFRELKYVNFIILDLVSVGAAKGLSTLNLCHQIRTELTVSNIVSGGGVSSIDDVRHAQDSGLDGLLIASAIHSGNLTPTDIKSVWNSPNSHPEYS